MPVAYKQGLEDTWGELKTILSCSSIAVLLYQGLKEQISSKKSSFLD